MSNPSPPDATTRGRDLRTISLVGLAHGTSHFFHMLLPPLFPVFKESFGLSYAELGLLVTLFFVISGIGQALAGFLVDRIGARPVLFAALGCFAASAASGALAQGYGGLLLAAALAGLGNSPFHPIDFTILNQRVSQARLGHAYAVHGISGNLGWAVAPLVLLGITGLTGSWRWALAACALWAHQNGLVPGAEIQKQAVQAIETSDLTEIHQAAFDTARKTRPLKLDAVGAPLTNWVDSFNVGIAGFVAIAIRC